MPLDAIPTSLITGNTVTVTANSGSSIGASNVNFNNSSTVFVSTQQGPTGTANVSFSVPSIRSLAFTIALGG
jgi:hypothetical protein